jgi:uncharacterized phage protein (TIGR01671 family)
MREYKFRAWDVEKKCMILWDEIADDWGMAIFSYPKEILVMQLTGLFDKTGKEIWEGDVVNVRNWVRTDEILHIAQIVWDKQTAGWDFDPFFDVDQYDKFRNLEVIGNIFENPNFCKSPQISPDSGKQGKKEL